MGIVHKVAHIGSTYYTKKEVRDLNKSLNLQHLIPKVSKRFSGKSHTGNATRETDDRTISRIQKKIFHLSLEISRDSAIVVLETIPYLASEGAKGCRASMPYIKVNVGHLTVDGFQRSTSVNLPVLARGLDLTFSQLIKRCEEFATDNRHRLNVQTEYKPGNLTVKIVRLIPKN